MGNVDEILALLGIAAIFVCIWEWLIKWNSVSATAVWTQTSKSSIVAVEQF